MRSNGQLTQDIRDALLAGEWPVDVASRLGAEDDYVRKVRSALVKTKQLKPITDTSYTARIARPKPVSETKRSRTVETICRASNEVARAIGTVDARGQFNIRRIVWGIALARAEKRPGERIRKVLVLVIGK